MIVKFYLQTLWPQPCHVMRHELKLELDNSRDKSDKIKFYCLSKVH